MKPYGYSLKLIQTRLINLKRERDEILDILERSRIMTTVGRGKYSLKIHKLNNEIEDLENTEEILNLITWQTEIQIKNILQLE